MSDELPSDDLPQREREILLRVADPMMRDIATRAYNASQDQSLGENDLRAILADMSLDLGALYMDARRIIEDENQGSAPESSTN